MLCTSARRRTSPGGLVPYEAKRHELPSVPLFVAHGREDTLSPYASQERFVELLKEANGPESVEFLTLEGRRWQHMNTTVRMHKSRVEESPIMKPLFAWLGELG